MHYLMSHRYVNKPDKWNDQNAVWIHSVVITEDEASGQVVKWQSFIDEPPSEMPIGKFTVLANDDLSLETGSGFTFRFISQNNPRFQEIASQLDSERFQQLTTS